MDTQSITKDSKTMFRCMLWFVAAMAIFAAQSAVAQDTTWNITTDGSWSDGGNWDSGLPDGNWAALTHSGTQPEITVTFTNPAAPSFQRLLVNDKMHLVIEEDYFNWCPNAASLCDSVIEEGGCLTVTNGGVWRNTGTNNVNGASGNILTVQGHLVIDGGEISFTNLPSISEQRRIMIVSSQTGRIDIVNGGVFNFTVGATDSDNHPPDLTIGEWAHGIVNIDASTLHHECGAYSGATMLNVGLKGGAYGMLSVSNNGVYEASASPGTIVRGYIGYGGRGELRVRSGGLVVLPPTAVIVGYARTHSHDAEGLVDIKDGTVLCSGTIDYGAAWDATYSATGTLRVVDGVCSNKDLTIGRCFNGVLGSGRMVMAGNARVHVGYKSNGEGMALGRFDGLSSTGEARGVLDMTNGVLYIEKGARSPSASYPVIGLKVGHAHTNMTGHAYGEINLHGGTITNEHMFVLGSYGGTGVVNQTGGAIDCTGEGQVTSAMILGMNGGSGTYTMYDGSLTVNDDLFVGGPSGLGWGAALPSTGALNVYTGSVSVAADTLYVGASGTGTVTVGNAGSITANALTATSASATLRFVLGPSGMGTITVNNALTLSGDSKLEIDAAQGGIFGEYDLVTAGDLQTPFAEENITVNYPSGWTLTQDAGDNNKITLLLCPLGTMVSIK